MSYNNRHSINWTQGIKSDVITMGPVPVHNDKGKQTAWTHCKGEAKPERELPVWLMVARERKGLWYVSNKV